MSDLDRLGHRHAGIVRASLADAQSRHIDSLREARPRPHRPMWIALASAAVVVAVLLPTVLLWDRIGQGDLVPATTMAAEATTTTGTEAPPQALPPFDVEAFLASKLAGAFGESEDRVAVVVLFPSRTDGTSLDAFVVGRRELEGYVHVSAESIEAAAARFAQDRSSEPLAGAWMAYGLIPRFFDSPTDEWVASLSRIPELHVASVDFTVETRHIPEGWAAVADLPFEVTNGAIVAAVDAGVVVLQPGPALLIGLDGSWATGEPPPLSIPAACCGPARGLPAGDAVVLVGEVSPATWILDVGTLTWRQADSRPTAGYPLGSALIDGDLFVVTAAARTAAGAEAGVTSVAALNVTTGAWVEIEPVPSPISVGGVTTDGHRLIVAGTRQDHNNHIIGVRHPVAYQYTPDDGWRQLPGIPISGQAATVTWIEGTGLLSWNYDLESAVLDGSAVWRSLDSVPMPPAECYPQSFPTTTGAAGICGGLALFEAATETWHPVRPTYDTRYAVTETALIGLVAVARDETRMIIYPIAP